MTHSVAAIKEDDPELRHLVDDLGCDESQAKFMIAMRRGFISGDRFPKDMFGNPIHVVPFRDLTAPNTVSHIKNMAV